MRLSSVVGAINWTKLSCLSLNALMIDFSLAGRSTIKTPLKPHSESLDAICSDEGFINELV